MTTGSAVTNIKNKHVAKPQWTLKSHIGEVKESLISTVACELKLPSLLKKQGFSRPQMVYMNVLGKSKPTGTLCGIPLYNK